MRNWNAERAERIFQEKEVRQLAITEATSDLVATADIDGFFISLNKAGFDLLGLDKDTDISALRLVDFYSDEAASYFSAEEVPNAMKFSVWHSETLLKPANKEEIPCSQVLIAHTDKYAQVTFFSVILRDIRSIKAAEVERQDLMEQLHQSQKMETVGRLAGGVAHDFNNILTVIIGYAELGLLNATPSSIAKEELEIILTSAQKAARLSSQLLDFSTVQMIEPQSLDLNEVIKSSLPLIQSLLGETIQLDIELPEMLWQVNIDHSQLEQVILNLAVNARDAIIQPNGHVTITTKNLVLNSTEAIQQGLSSAGEYVLLTISDTGCGMSDEIKAHIFEPFYTTKNLAKNTGLGLASVYGAIKQNNGHIYVTSTIGRGTSFQIYLHRSQNESLSALQFNSNNLEQVKPSENILLVEDNQEVRTLLARLLIDIGYQVIEAKDGEDAIKKFNTCLQKQPIDLIISDIVMPTINGIELYNKLVKIQPELNILLISAHTDQATSIQNMNPNKVKLLSKPIPSKLLAQEIRSLLD